MTASAIYVGTVTHTRAFPKAHRLRYGVWYLLVDLDELEELDRRVRGFGVERPAPVSFRARDHGARDGSALRPWAQARLREAGLDGCDGPIRILCLPRVLGYVFNPLSVWFCHSPQGELRGLIYEVSNTFGGHHAYVVPVEPDKGAGTLARSSFPKELFVSPFIDMDARYEFTTRVPDDRVSVAVRETVPQGTVLRAALTARRVPLTGANLARVFLTYPLVTLKVIVGIHREALRLWRKGAPFRRPPERPVRVA